MAQVHTEMLAEPGAPAEVDRGRAPGRTCADQPGGRAARCQLPFGHVGYHEARIRTRRANGVVVGYRYVWLDE